MARFPTLVRSLLALMIWLATAAPVSATSDKSSGYRTGFTRWRASAGDFAAWSLDGVQVGAEGVLELGATGLHPGNDPNPAKDYYGHFFYHGGSFVYGEATSPPIPTSFGFTEAIASWNAGTPAGTWLEIQISAQVGAHWTKWYNLGVWDDDNSTVERHSVNLQGDTDGYVAVDTLVLSRKMPPATAFKLKLRLFRATGSGATPSVRNAAVALSTTPEKPGTLTPGNPSLWHGPLAVPECSQMIYEGGGEVWCSPTSVSMVLGYWGKVAGLCAEREQIVVPAVFDWLYDGHGNWPFNTAYAATQGLEGYVARFSSMAQIEPWTAAGVPVVISYAWKKSDLAGAPIASSNGHLAVIVGFTAQGDPIVNDPAAPGDSTVQRTYRRAQLESLWLEHSGGTVYLIYPAGSPTPNL